MRRLAAFVFALTFAAAALAGNDDSCDIATAPAATLFLPYFEVDLGGAGNGRTTVFSVTNVSPYSQIARVTLWTDWAFPVLTFNLFLTGYDVQPVNLYDVIVRGAIAQTSTASPNPVNRTNGVTPFHTSEWNGNPNLLASASATCAPDQMPGQLPGALITDIRALLSTGRSTGAGLTCPGPGGEQQVGGNHGGNIAVGYITIDVVATCAPTLPIEVKYYAEEILFDNVLIGDYADVVQNTTAGNYAGGNTMVHIRAIPEGGPAGGPAIATNLPFTFYDRYTHGTATRTIDRRQPLPSAFAARWISGSAAAFDTQYKIWREGYTTGIGGGFAACSDYIVNSAIPLVEMVRFDERENAGIQGTICCITTPTTWTPATPATSRAVVWSSLFPIVAGSTDVGGWVYMNLNNGGNATASFNYGMTPYQATRPGFGSAVVTSTPRDVSQSWVVLSMFAEGRYGTDFDAAWLANGCTPALASINLASSKDATGRIGPGGGTLVCPEPVHSPQCTGTNVTP